MKPNLFDSVSHDVRLNEKDNRCFKVLQFELGEARILEMLPSGAGHLTAVSEVVPKRLQNVLTEVCPGALFVRNHMLHEEESTARPEHTQSLSQGLGGIPDGAEDQAAGHHVHGLILNRPQILP